MSRTVRPASRRAVVGGALAAGAALAAAPLAARGQGDATPGASPAAGGAAASRRVRVGDIDVAYRVLGRGEPLLMVMGFSGTMDLWDPAFLAPLAARRQLVLFDNRGYGGTSANGPYPFAQLADDTAGLADALGLGRVDVLGWSLGGSIALDLCLRHPATVRRAVLVAASPGGTAAVPAAPEVTAVLTDESGSDRERGLRLLAILFPEAWLRTHQTEVLRAFNRPMETATPEANRLLGEAFGRWDGVGDRLGEIAQPTMLVQGLDDVIVPPRNAELLAAGIPGSWLVRLRDTGHAPMVQEPLRLAALTDVFLT